MTRGIQRGKRIGGQRIAPLIINVGRWRIRVALGRYRTGRRPGSLALRLMLVTYIRRCA